MKWFKIKPQWKWERLGDMKKRLKEIPLEMVVGESSTEAKRVKANG